MNILQLVKNCQVEWKPLGEVAEIYGGLTGKNKNDFENGNAKYISYKNIFDNIEVNPSILEKVNVSEKERQHLVKYGDILFTGSSETANEAGMSSAVTTKFNENIYLNSFSFGVRFNENICIIPEFSKYLFRSHFMRAEIAKTASGVTRFNISKERFKKIKIPIPPLEIQQKIVQILDAFTAVTAELTAELTAEYNLRIKQYQYYRDKLLNFSDNVEWKSLGEVVDYLQPTKYLIKSTNYQDDYTTPVLTAGKTFVLGYTNETNGIYPAKNNPVIIFDDFTTANKWVDFDFKAKSSAMKIIIPKDENVLLKYVYYWLNTLPSEDNTDHKRQWISNYAQKQIPLPSLAEQKRIVGILDKFETLTHSISEGLPREIELRQKQYEYYRALLLGFE